MSQVSPVLILLCVAALACAGVAVWRESRPLKNALIVDRLLRYLFWFLLGLQGLWALPGTSAQRPASRPSPVKQVPDTRSATISPVIKGLIYDSRIFVT
jgi:hypothetical protein